MNDFQRQYLHEMGIDVWALKPDKPTARPDQTQAQSSVIEGSPEQATRSEPGAAARLALVREHREENSSRRAQASAGTAPSTSPDQGQEPGKDTPEFMFCFLDYENLSLVFSIPYQANALPREHRHFADDINFAISGKTGIPRIRDLRWPMIQAKHVQQTEEDARQVVWQKLGQCNERLYVFGWKVLGFIIESAQESDMGNTIKVKDKHLVILDEFNHYFDNPMDKRELWRFIQGQSQLQQEPPGAQI
jgi:hypothetical protein